MTELHGEKIDIVDYSPDPARFVAAALSPARVLSVEVVDEAMRAARVIVPDYQLSLAIGKEGQNARLAARLTGWRVDIKSETQLAEEEAYQTDDWAQGEWVVDATTGEQVWVPADGSEGVSAEAWAAGDPEADGAPAEADAADAEAPAVEVEAEAEAESTDVAAVTDPAEATDGEPG